MKQIGWHKYLQSKKTTSRFSGKAKLRDAGGGSNSENREWEVGKKGDCDNIDNAYTIKR